MKKRFLAYAFLLAAIVSVTSGCVVHDRYSYSRRYHHDRYHNGYNNGYDHYHDSTHDRNY
ncbi:hypothetical protein [Mucilaginibacter pocheonensis]|uniref:Lipoprotein n=1 Tax=Mucilaginibacter pocheonensis TaxID=398050 RepID=A0ABU1TIE0_9SPHI|nr:hypothetical protein [Mucilaginibacter pocheonensis]MDR6945177.1 hypothetical protein [Mucilaginibacter pocheonensis]